MTCLWWGRALCWKGQLWESFAFMTAGEWDVGSGMQRDNSWGQTQRLPLFLYLMSPEFLLPPTRPSKSPPSGLTHSKGHSLYNTVPAPKPVSWLQSTVVLENFVYSHHSINKLWLQIPNTQSFPLCLCLWPISTYSIFKVNPFNSLLISQRREFIT